MAHGRNIPLLPILDLFRAAFDVTAQDDARTVREKVAGRVLVTDAAAWYGMADAIVDTPALKHILLSQAAEIKPHPRFNVLDLASCLQAAKPAGTSYQTKANDAAYLVYTSGTTGYPKGVLHAHRALVGRQPAAQYWFNYSDKQQDRIMHSGKFNWTYVLGTGLMDPLYLEIGRAHV